MEVTLLPFKLGLISFWGLWFLILFLTNLCEACKVLRVAPATWKFASHNFGPLFRPLRVTVPPPWIPRVLFLGVLLWQSLAVTLFGWAIASCLSERALSWGPVNAAFASGLGLWAAFMIADAIFKEYDTERSHVLFLSRSW